MKTDMSRYLANWILIILLASLTMSTHLCVATSRYEEDEIKVVLIYHFTKFIEWPPEAFSRDANTEFALCIFGANPFGNALANIQGKPVKGKRLVTQRVDRTVQLNTCHMLYVNASEAVHMASILAYVKTLPIVTISDLAGFARMGGIFNFVRSKDNIGFEVNPNAARRAGVTIRSKLLRLAETVIQGDVER